jgi:two-component system, OmpR family, response regulator
MPRPADPTPTRVLLVEDDDPLREAMSRVLSRAGYEVVAVSNGADAVERGHADRPDAAVIDVFLRDAGGLGVARGLRQDWADVPVLFITGLGLPAVRQALAPAPVLFKPFSRRQLLESLAAVAGPARAP